MTMYIQGYGTEEQNRLVRQAEYLREKLILRDLNFSGGEKLLEIGCGVGAVLGEIGKAFPDLDLTGIDIEPKQIEYARTYLRNLGLDNVKVNVGDAALLPWADASFDHVYGIWVLEHISNYKTILQEAYRVLKPGGTITFIEGDYKTLLIWPESYEYSYLQDALCETFNYSGGNPNVGRFLGPLLFNAGFREVRKTPLTMNYSYALENEELHQLIDWLSSSVEQMIPQITEYLGKDRSLLEAGLEFFRNIKDNPEGVASIGIYHVTAKRL